MWRLVLASRGSITLTEIRDNWRYVDVVKANVMLNAVEAAEARASARASAAAARDNG